MRWSAERVTAIGFAVALTMLVVVGVVSFRNTVHLRQATAFEQRSRDVLDDLRELSSAMKDIETSGTGYALSGNPRFLQNYRLAVPHVRSILNKLPSELNDQGLELLFTELDPAVQQTLLNTEAVVTARGAGGAKGEELLASLLAGRDIVDKVREIVGRMQAREFEMLQERLVDADSSQRELFFVLQLGSVSGVVFLALAMVVIFIDLRQRKRMEASLREATSLQNAILSGAGSGIIATDAAGIITSFNQAAENLLGYKASELVGRVSPVIFNDAVEISSRAQALSRELGFPVEVGFETLVAKSRFGPADSNEWTYIRRDGTRVPVLVSVSTLRNSAGEITGYLGVASDITEVRAAQEQLRHAEYRFRALIQGSNDVVLMLSPRGEILYVSPAVERTLGYLPEDLVGKEVFQFIHPEDVPPARVSFGRTLSASGIAVPMELRMRSLDGKYHWIESLANNLLHDADLRAIVVNARDVTERRELERRSALQSVVTAVLAESQTLGDASGRLLEVICKQMGYDHGELWRVDPENANLALVEHWHSEKISEIRAREFSVGFHLDYGEGIPGAVWETGEVVLVPDISKALAYRRARRALELGFRCAFAIPIKFDDEVIAIMDFSNREAPLPDERTVDIFRSLGSQIGNFMARKRAEEAADRLRRQTQLILESAGEGIIGIDTRQHVTFVNAAAERMLGYRTGELVGRELMSTIRPAKADGTPIAFEDTPMFAALEQIASRSIADGLFFRKDASSIPVQYTGAPIRTDNGVAGAVITFQDITQRQEIDRMKNEFVSVVSHELRTPLTSIRGALGLLASGKMGGFPDKAQRMLDIAVSNTDRLVRLINDILDIERINSGRIAMQKTELDIADLMTQAVEVMRAMADKAGVILELLPIHCVVEVDADRMIQTFTNLLSNAIKFSPSGSIVTIGGRTDRNTLHLYVKDQGRGIPADKIEAIFERFHQVDASDSREKGGTGLGLAICRTIVQQHGGRIWAESKEGHGSTFYIYLPLVGKGATKTAKRGASILVCDDDPAVLEVVGTMLHARGFHVTTVSSGQDAVRKAQLEFPDVVLLDLVMPDMDGWQVLERLKSSTNTMNLPVIVLSGMNPNEARRPDNARIAGWVTKPLDESELFSTLSKVLRGLSGKPRVLVVEQNPELGRVLRYMLEGDGVLVEVATNADDAMRVIPNFHPELIAHDLTGDEGFRLSQWLRSSKDFHHTSILVYCCDELSQPERDRLTVGFTEFLLKSQVPPDDFEQRILSLVTQMTTEPSDTLAKGKANVRS
jgi:PAS domain S-box-containing protein